MKILEFFAGTRSIGKAFEKRGHEVFSVEWDKRFEDIDLYGDISVLTAQEILEAFGQPDVIWASPDCTKHDSRNRSRYHGEERSKHRSKTFQGIAEAMADQWGRL